jgi:hypothetical protein
MSKRKSYSTEEKLEAITRVKQRCETQYNESRNNGTPVIIVAT